ncbi:MAG: ATP-binding cassette domain-containing protein, partial [Myxococcota bacterium]
PDIVDDPNAVELPPLERSIQFDDVHFHYRPDSPVLKGISLEIPVGSTVALVGATGCGKSTIAQLLPRFYDVTAGRILVDGTELRHASISSLRSQISVVSQDTFLFNTSVLENIRYGQPKASLDDVHQAARAAHAQEFIERLPQGYDTVIGERGVTLSGGQRQRLAIARAILRNAPVLILDEATSALDAEVESIVQGNLDAFMAQRTSLVIAHRLSTIRNADRIVVLGEGRILETGTHSELLENRGAYAKLHAMQFEEERASASGSAVH